MFRSPSLLLFWIAAAVCVAGQVAVLRAMAAGRAPGTSRRPVARWTEVVWVVLPAVILGVVLAATWRAVDERAAATGSTAFRATASSAPLSPGRGP